MNPAASAQRLMFGTGLGLLLATGFAYISGIATIDSVGAEFIVPFLGICLIGFSQLVMQENGVFSVIFPNEDSSAAAQKISNELSDTRKNEEIGDAWAKLEHSMLSKELEEE